MTISKYLSCCIESPNHDDLAKLWIDITKQKIICVNPEEQIFYKFDTEQMLYVKLLFQEFSELVKSDIRQYLNEIKALNTDKRLTDLIKKCGDKGYSDNISKTIASKIYNKEFLTNLDSDVNVINFKNGFVNLKTGDFSKRTEDDFFSICLDYDYSEEKNNKLITEIKDVLKKICNDDDTLLNFKLSWSGYCLTGHTTEQKSLWEIGYSASNGKSTFAKIFMKCFDKYCYKMNREALETGYSKIHKEISQTKGIRFVVIEELRRKKLNESLYKDLVDGDKLNNEVLYSTTEEIKIKFKLDIITNNDPNFNNDNGMVRRGILINFTNRFIDKEDYDRMKNKKESLKGIYVKDKNLLEKFNDQKYKLAFFHLLLEYSRQYYISGLKIPESFLDNFKGLCDENDKMKRFIETNFENTNNDGDIIYKDEFFLLYNNYTKFNNNWTSVLNDIKRLNIKYDSRKHINYDGKRVQGCIIGLKLKDKVINEEITVNSPFDINYKKDDLQEKLNEALKEIEYLKNQLKLKDSIQIKNVNKAVVNTLNDYDYKDDSDDDYDIKEPNLILDDSELKEPNHVIDEIIEPKKKKIIKKTTKRKNTNNITNNKVNDKDFKYTMEEVSVFRNNSINVTENDLEDLLGHFK